MTDLADRLHSYWIGDTFFDSRAAGQNHLTQTGTVGIVAGHVGNAWDFGAASNMLSRAHALTNGIDPVAGESLSLMFWLKMNVLRTTELFIKSDSTGSATKGWGFRVAGGGGNIPSFYYVLSGGGGLNKRFINSPTLITAGSWFHIACVHEFGVGNHIYVNTNKTSLLTENGNWEPSVHDLNVGAFNGVSSLTGLMDETMFYKNRAIQQADVDWAYNGGAGRSIGEVLNSGNQPYYGQELGYRPSLSL